MAKSKVVKFDGENAVEPIVLTENYDKFGKLTNNEKLSVACKTVNANGKDEVLYFVKRDKYNNVFDPLDLYYNEGDEAKVDVRYGGSVFNFIVVNEDVYDLYMKYLRDRRSHVFNEVKRRLING
jgi:hypothetical protein